MPLLLLLLLTAVCVPFKWPGPPDWVVSFGSFLLSWFGVDAPEWGGFLGSILLTWLGIAGVVACAGFLAHATRWQLALDPARREVLHRRHASVRLYHSLGLFTVYGLALYVLGWGWVVQGGPLQEQVWQELPGTELLVLAPLLAGLVLSWACFYDAERALHEAGTLSDSRPPYWSRGAYVTFRLRQNLALVFIPVLLLILVNNLPRMFPETEGAWRKVAGSVTLLSGLAVFACIPWVVRLLLGWRPMPDGPLRKRLLAASQRLRCRCSNILLWNTRGGVANAMVIGILPVLRYVVLTDRLVGEMTPDEVEAVFGHEVGHVKHRHMLYYLGFLTVSLLVLAGIWHVTGLQSWMSQDARQHLATLLLSTLLVIYLFVVFGFVSRRCERQADIYGCRAVSCARPDCHGHETSAVLLPGGRGLCPTGIRTFINALEKVASLNGISRDRPGWLQSWQHSTIARRVEFLRSVLADPAVEPRFQRAVRLVKWMMLLGLGALMLLLGKHWEWSNLLSF